MWAVVLRSKPKSPVLIDRPSVIYEDSALRRYIPLTAVDGRATKRQLRQRRYVTAAAVSSAAAVVAAVMFNSTQRRLRVAFTRSARLGTGRRSYVARSGCGLCTCQQHCTASGAIPVLTARSPLRLRVASLRRDQGC